MSTSRERRSGSAASTTRPVGGDGPDRPQRRRGLGDVRRAGGAAPDQHRDGDDTGGRREAPRGQQRRPPPTHGRSLDARAPPRRAPRPAGAGAGARRGRRAARRRPWSGARPPRRCRRRRRRRGVGDAGTGSPRASSARSSSSGCRTVHLQPSSSGPRARGGCATSPCPGAAPSCWRPARASARRRTPGPTARCCSGRSCASASATTRRSTSWSGPGDLVGGPHLLERRAQGLLAGGGRSCTSATARRAMPSSQAAREPRSGSKPARPRQALTKTCAVASSASARLARLRTQKACTSPPHRSYAARSARSSPATNRRARVLLLVVGPRAQPGGRHRRGTAVTTTLTRTCGWPGRTRRRRR